MRPAATRRGGSRRPAKKRSLGQVRLTTAVIIATVILAAWSVYPVFRLQYEHQRELDSLETELDGLKSRNEELRDEVEELKTPEGVEELARASLGLVRPGEQAYVVTGGTLSETTATVLPSGETESPLWQKALDSLFGLN